jgi:uncharacterized protein YigE (DUF2233 family)
VQISVRLPLAAALTLLFALSGRAPAETPSARKSPCAPISFEGRSYTICEAPLDRFSIRLFWRRPDGEPYGYLSSLPKTGEKGERLAFALNAGMFHPDYKPVGLYVENGRELVRANTNNGPGNFHLKPNGVFYVNGNEAGVMETGAFLKNRPNAAFATQSGPMLVIKGRLHPRLAKASTSEKRRDGVCVRGRKVVLFAISDGGVPFDSFLRLFRDGLKCSDALFLDGGSAPALYVPSASSWGSNLSALGPLIGVYEKQRP